MKTHNRHSATLAAIFAALAFLLATHAPAQTLLWGKVSGPWASQFDGSFGTIAVNPSNPNIILIGSGVLGGPGVLKSTDGGATWTAKNTGITMLGIPAQNLPPITKIVFSASNPSIVYLGAAVDNLLAGGAGYIYKSVDGGESWQQVNGQKNILGVSQIQGAVYDLDVNPVNPNMVYAGVGGQGIMKTTDGGSNWSTVYAASSTIGAVDYFTVVRILPTQPNTVFFSGYTYYTEDAIPVPIDFSTTGTQGLVPIPLHRSTDGGSTWPTIPDPSTAMLITDLQFEKTTGNLYESTIAYQTPLFFNVGNRGIFKSLDSGQTWQSINQASFASLDQLPFVALLANPSSVNGGVFASGGLSTMFIGTTDAGAHWLNLDPCLLNAYIGRAAFSANNLVILTSVGVYEADASSLFPSVSQAPSITSVSPPKFTGLPIGQTRLIRVIGSGFTSSSTLTFNDGVTSYSGKVPIFVSANELDYNITTGTNQANWTVRVFNGAQQSNLGTFTVNAPTSPPATTGSLFVNLSPAGAISAGAQWQVDGTGYNSSGQVVGYLTTGSHTVSFKPISGYTTPANQIVTINANAQTTASGTYSVIAPSTCTLTLNYDPAQGGASPSPLVPTISYTYGSYNFGYTVNFTTLVQASASTGYHFTGWSGDASGSANPITVTMNGSKNITANFAVGDPNLGTLTVTIQPPEAAAAGVTWGFNETDFRASGSSVTTYPISSLIYVHMVSGWSGAGVYPVTIIAGQTTNYTVAVSSTTGNTVGTDPRTYSTFAGLARTTGSSDGTNSAARFNNPWHIAVDTSGNLYVADYGNHTIRKITPAGMVSTLAGLAGSPASTDGTGSAARFNMPIGIAVDTNGNVYVGEYGNSTIRKITPGGVVSTLAGLAGNTGSADGTGSAARFKNPNGVAVDNSGNVYVADYGNYTIRKITPGGVVSTLAGLAGSRGTADGVGTAARFFYPGSIAVDNAGSLFVADTFNHTIRKITSDGTVTTLAGFPGSGGAADGTGTAARFSYPAQVAVDSIGTVYVADNNNSTIRKVTPAGVASTLAGLSGHYGTNDGNGNAVRFQFATGVAIDSAGNLFVADNGNSTIRTTRQVGKSDQLITFALLPDKTASDAPFSIAATSSSGLPVYLNVLSGPAVLDTNNVLTLLGAGTVTIIAWQPGNTNYNAAVPVQQSFNVSQIPQTIAFGALSQQRSVDAPFPIYASASSGLSVSFSVLSGPAQLSGNVLTLTGAGTVTVRASQAGSSVFAPAANVDQSLTVLPPSNTVGSPQYNVSGFNLTFYGAVGSNYLFQASSNLVNWTTLQSFSCTNIIMNFRDASATGMARRFYQIKPQ